MLLGTVRGRVSVVQGQVLRVGPLWGIAEEGPFLEVLVDSPVVDEVQHHVEALVACYSHVLLGDDLDLVHCLFDYVGNFQDVLWGFYLHVAFREVHGYIWQVGSLGHVICRDQKNRFDLVGPECH